MPASMPSTASVPSASRSAVGVTPQVQKHIGNLLKSAYADVLESPIPDRFTALLDQLEKSTKTKS